MKRERLLKNIKSFLERIDGRVDYRRYVSTPDQADAPYRQRKRSYDDPIQLVCTIAERKTDEMPTLTGDSRLRRFEIGLSPDQILPAFHPLDYDDPRKAYDPSLILSNKDMITVRGVACRIESISRHGDDGGGPTWYLIYLKEDVET